MLTASRGIPRPPLSQPFSVGRSPSAHQEPPVQSGPSSPATTSRTTNARNSPARRSYQERWYPESRFGGFTDIDGTVAFYGRVNALLTESSVAVDLGCGRGAQSEDSVRFRRELRMLRGKCAKVIGLDVDEAARTNPSLDEFRLIGEGPLPLEDQSADLIVSDSVVEHLTDPDSFFAECSRVLRPGGHLCIRTPNVLSYLGLLSTVVPNRLHARVLGRVQSRRKAEDVFPTVYRCNTLWSMRRQLTRHGFEHGVYTYEAEPSYLSFSGFAYWLGVMHQRHAPGFLKLTLFAFGRKL